MSTTTSKALAASSSSSSTYGVDDEVVPLGKGVGLGTDKGLVEVQSDDHLSPVE